MDSNVLSNAITDAFRKVLAQLLEFFPDMMTSALIFTAGLFLGLAVRFVFLKFLRAVKIDKISEKAGVSQILTKGGIKRPLSEIFSAALGGAVVVSFLMLSFRSLRMPAVDSILEKFIFYLPNIFVSAGIIFGGYMLSIFLGRAVLIASVNSGFRLSGLMANSVRISIFLLAITMAFEQLQIAGRTVVIAFSIICGGVVFALSLAFGLAGKDLAKEYLEKKLRGEERDEIAHL